MYQRKILMSAIAIKISVVTIIIFLSPFWYVNSTFAEKQEVSSIKDQILNILNSSEYNHDKRSDMPTDYKYSFQDKCHFLVHSEWYGKSHADIADTLIPMAGIEIKKEIENDSYFLYVICKNNKKCIEIKGNNTGDPYQYMFIQAFIYAGHSEQSYYKIKGMFEKVISECSK
jgi:hypothetical protein